MKIVHCFGLFVVMLSMVGMSAAVWADSNSTLTRRTELACEGLLTPEGLQQALQMYAGKTIIIDTNVLLNDPYAIYKFPGAHIVIPGTVLEEIDDKKKDQKVGWASAEFSRIMDEIIRQGNISQGIEIQKDTWLQVDARNVTEFIQQTTFDRAKRDNEIISLALEYTLMVPGYGNTILISDDTNVRVKASSQGIVTSRFEIPWVTSARQIEHNRNELIVSAQELQEFQANGSLAKPAELTIAPNEFVYLRTSDGEASVTNLARYFYDRENPELSQLRKLTDYSHLGVVPKNDEQAMLQDVLYDPTIDLVIVEAGPGTGKTFLALSAGVQQMPGPLHLDTDLASRYMRGVKLTRPMTQLGRENLGLLPGGKDEKLVEITNNYADNMERLDEIFRGLKATKKAELQPNNKSSRRENLNAGMEGRKPETKLGQAPKIRTGPMEFPGVELLAFSGLRGRSIHQAYIILDEAQNTSVHEAKTVLTRAGENTKMIVIGDASQIDDPVLNERNNGLSVTASLFTAEDMSDSDRSRVAFVRLVEGVRSPLAELARQRFKEN